MWAVTSVHSLTHQRKIYAWHDCWIAWNLRTCVPKPLVTIAVVHVLPNNYITAMFCAIWFPQTNYARNQMAITDEQVIVICCKSIILRRWEVQKKKHPPPFLSAAKQLTQCLSSAGSGQSNIQPRLVHNHTRIAWTYTYATKYFKYRPDSINKSS